MDSFVFYYWVLRGLILDTIPLLDKRFENIFSCCLSFHPFPMHFHKAKVLNFVRSSLLLSSLKPFCLTLDPKDVLLYFSLKGLYFYIFMSYIYIQIHFEFSYMSEVEGKVHSFPYGCPVAPAPFIERLSFFHWIAFAHMSKISSAYLCASVSGFSITFFYVSVPLPFPHCLAHCSYIISLNTR